MITVPQSPKKVDWGNLLVVLSSRSGSIGNIPEHRNCASMVSMFKRGKLSHSDILLFG